MEAHGTAAQRRPPIVPRLRPLTLTEMLDVAIKLCVTHAATLLKAVLVVVLPVQIAATAIIIATGGADFDVFSSAMPTGKTTAEKNTYLAGQLGANLMTVLAIGLVTAACFHALARAYLNETTAWRDTLGFALRRAPQMLVIGLIYLGAFVGGFLVLLSVAAAGGSGGAIVLAGGAFLVLGVWLYVAWSVALPALLVEDARGLAALRRSSALIQGRWWQTFGVILVGVLIALVVTIVVQLMFAFVIAAGIDRSSLAALLIVSAGGLVALAITAPFQAALLVVLYIDLRVRREGFGLEELAARLGVDVVEEPAVAEAGFEPPPADDDSAPYWPAPGEPRPPLGAPGPVPDLGPPPPGWRPPG